MGSQVEKVVITHDSNMGHDMDTVLYVWSSRSSDTIVVYDEDGFEVLHGTDDFMYKLGKYLTGESDDSHKTQVIKNVTQEFEEIRTNRQ